MKINEMINNQQGKIPIPLILGLVVVIGGAVFAFLAFSGVIYIPGITPEDEEKAPVTKIEISPEEQLEGRIMELARSRDIDRQRVSQLEETVELKDERIGTLQAEIDRLEGLLVLADENAVKDVAAVYEKMGADSAGEILAKFDPEKSVLILQAMDEKKAAAIIEVLDADLAAQITQIMAGFVKPFGGVRGTPQPAAPANPSASGG
jgi:flagellar motility protein MotE (MotC chaperone)